MAYEMVMPYHLHMPFFIFRDNLLEYPIKKELIQAKRISSFLNIPKKDYL